MPSKKDRLSTLEASVGMSDDHAMDPPSLVPGAKSFIEALKAAMAREGIDFDEADKPPRRPGEGDYAYALRCATERHLLRKRPV
jgi:hypothetical protein